MLSTSDVARLLGVAPGSVANWIDQGQLKAGRTPGGHRRIEATELVEFAQRHNWVISPEVGSAPRVLVVDDEPSVTKWIAEEVRAKYPDFEVVEAHDGFSAGQLVESLKPEVVILDLRMPDINGYEVCRRIKSKGDTKDAVVIAMTAYPSPEAERAIIECGARVCLTKPLDADVLLKELGASLHQHRWRVSSELKIRR